MPSDAGQARRPTLGKKKSGKLRDNRHKPRSAFFFSGLTLVWQALLARVCADGKRFHICRAPSLGRDEVLRPDAAPQEVVAVFADP